MDIVHQKVLHLGAPRQEVDICAGAAGTTRAQSLAASGCCFGSASFVSWVCLLAPMPEGEPLDMRAMPRAPSHTRPGPTRYLPGRPLPPYAFIAGHSPHPRKAPEGHSYGLPEPEAVPLTPSNWPTHEVYLRGIDLFNHGYYWEAHEQWEALWVAAGRVGQDAAMLKALIKLAAAGIKVRQGRPKGVQIHCQRAAASLRAYAEEARRGDWYGLSVTGLLEVCEGLLGRADGPWGDEELAVEQVHETHLRLSPWPAGAAVP